jgi:cytochrome c oxidase subunit 2
MAKIFAIIIVLIAIGSAIPIVMHMWPMPQDISTHGYLIDEQYTDTMWEAGLSFLASQFLLAFFIWKFSSPNPGSKIKSFPGGAAGLVIAAFLLVGTECLALGVFGVKAWASVYLTPPAANAMPIQAQAGQFAFYFRYPGPDGTFGPLHADQISEANANFFGLDTTHDQDSGRSICSCIRKTWAIPSTSPNCASSRISFQDWMSRFTSRQRRLASTKSSVRSFVASGITT